MEKKPLISIITVCYNSEKTIRDTIESVLTQTYTNIEYILIDGKSTDNTIDVIKSYEEKAKNKGIIYRWISEADRGIYDAMNKGIKIANGDYIALLNSDDWYEERSLGKAIKLIRENDEIIYFNIYKYLDENNKIKCIGNIDINNLNRLSLNHSGMLVKKEIYLKNGLYSLNYKIAADREFVIRNLKLGTKFRGVNFYLTNFSLEGESNQFYDFKKNYFRIIEEYKLLKKNKINNIIILKIVLKKIKTIYGNYTIIKLFGRKKAELFFKRRMLKKFELEKGE